MNVIQMIKYDKMKCFIYNDKNKKIYTTRLHQPFYSITLNSTFSPHKCLKNLHVPKKKINIILNIGFQHKASIHV